MKIDKKKVFTLFALTVLVLSLLLVNMNLPTGAQVTPQPIYLHGPTLTPIHMNSNITLTPVHMHYKEGILEPYQYEDPRYTYWHELYPNNCTDWQLTSWNDTGEPYLEFSPNDQIDMTNQDTQEVCWYHVDRITYTLNLSWPFPNPTERIFVELKAPPTWDPYMDPFCTLWHEVWPSYSNVYHCLGLAPGSLLPLDYCDTIILNNTKTGVQTNWHVDGVATDIILREKIMDPICTWWHAIYPEDEYCKWYHITSWKDFGWPYDMLSPSDQIDMTEEESGNVTWYHVDRVTVTLNVTDQIEFPTKWMKIELKTYYFEDMYEVFKHPLFSSWHEVYPYYSNVYNLTGWDLALDDNCNGVLDPCDWIWLLNMTSGDLTAKPERWHIADMTYDLILNEKISDPVCTDWHAIYPPEEYCNWYHIDEWNDTQPEDQPGHGLLSPCDYVNLTLQPGGPKEEYHVENVTLTLNVSSWDDPEEFKLIEAVTSFEEMYLPKTEPWAVDWHEVWPSFSNLYYIEWGGWKDNCNGVLDYCDNVTLIDPVGYPTNWHIEEVAVDMVVKKIVEQPPPPPPPPMYWKANYTDYAPSGVPDFNQRQDLFNVTGMWTWCVPTAVANSLWWMDSRFETSTTPPPTVSNTFNLVSNYTPGIDDHDPQNVQPFIQHLAYLMDTDGIRTQSGLTAHPGTLVSDAQAGIAHYLSWTGLNPLGDVNGDGRVNQTDYNIALAANNTVPGIAGWNMAADVYPVTLGWPAPGMADNVVNQSDLDLINAHMNENGTFYEKTVKTPSFAFVEEEVERCEDVILLLDFYTQGWDKTTNPLKELGHAVTVAGVNSTSVPPMIAISDPDNDNAEPPPQGTSGPGRVLPPGVPHVHNATPPHTLHNNASYVSHDIYNVTFIAPPPPVSNASWALDKYPGPIGCPYAVVEWAIIVSPLPPEEVCGVNITDVKLFKVVQGVSHAVSQGYQTWAPGKIFVNVTVHNNGTLTTNCTVNVYYYNVTAHLIGTQNLTDYDPCNTTTLTFAWDVSTVPRGIYTIKANVTCTCGVSDEFIDGRMKIKKVGDVTGNDVVDIFDLSATALATAVYYQQCDFDLDGDVDIFDLSAVALATAGG